MDYLTTGSDFLARQPDFKLCGRDAELRSLASLLLRSNASSVLLAGPGGVGCTAIIQGLQVAKSAPDAPFDLARRRMFWLDTDSLFGTAKDVAGEFQRVLTRIAQVDGSILVVEDTRDLIDACRNAGVMHLLNALLSGVRQKRYQLILESREDDIDEILRTSSDARELLTILPIDEPRGAVLDEIVSAALPGLTRFHGIRVDAAAVAVAVRLSNKHPPRDARGRAQPDRSVSLLDRALASYRMSAHADPRWSDQRARLSKLYAERRDAYAALDSLEAAVEEGENLAHTSELSPLQTSSAGEIRSRMSIYRQLLADNLASAARIEAEVDANLVLTEEEVEREFSAITGIPVSKLREDERARLRALPANLSARIFGQDEIIDHVARAVRVARLGRRTDAPAAFLFLGPSGVGKTEMAKALAALLFDDEAALLRFDMSEYMEKHAVAKLIGAPPGYEGFAAGGLLTNAVRRRPYCVALFDEIEKAHPDVFNVFLQVLSDGRLTDGLGRTAAFGDALVVMTTNIGQTHFLAGGEDAREAALLELAQTYRPEFLNRFEGRQNILCFKPLGLDAMRKIVDREILDMDATYRPRGLPVMPMKNGEIETFCRLVYDPTIGARGLPGIVRGGIEGALVERMLDQGNLRATVLPRYSEERGLYIEFAREGF